MPEITERLSTALADRYKIERHLGEGGMATVYLAEDLKHKRKVAVKVLRPELAAVLGAERFVQEITTTANLQHPHILPLFDSGEADGFLYYVMPFVEGETLRDKLNRETQLGIDEAVGITTDIANALDYAHRNNVIHRDIKPENILLQEGHPVVADFGIALALSMAGGDRITATGLAIGTPAYMSPEQATGMPPIDARSDIYSLGCLAYEMLGGAPPFTGPSPQAVMARHSVDPVPRLRTLRPGIHRSVEQAVEKALAKVPADRFVSAREFADTLMRGCAAEPSAPAGSVALRLRSLSRRRKLFLLGLVALGVVISTAVAVSFRDAEPDVTEALRENIGLLEMAARTGALNALCQATSFQLPEPRMCLQEPGVEEREISADAVRLYASIRLQMVSGDGQVHETLCELVTGYPALDDGWDLMNHSLLSDLRWTECARFSFHNLQPFRESVETFARLLDRTAFTIRATTLFDGAARLEVRYGKDRLSGIIGLTQRGDTVQGLLFGPAAEGVDELIVVENFFEELKAKGGELSSPQQSPAITKRHEPISALKRLRLAE